MNCPPPLLSLSLNERYSLERLLSGVYAVVSCKSSRDGEPFPADLALVGRL